MRRLGRRVAAVGRAVDPPPNAMLLAYARAVVAFGGADPRGEDFERAAVGYARWLERGGKDAACGPG